jgi:sugar lactone lactonase YvrE
MKKPILLAFSTLFLMACNTGQKSDSTEAPVTEAPQEKGYVLTEVWRTDTLLRTCESVLYDQQLNTLFVSCINGTPTDKNGAGYIARVSPTGTIETLEWVTGLNAPKGMGRHENMLYVTDIDELVIIDINRGEVAERIPLDGASFLNDIDVDTDGTVYISDSDTGILWKYENGELSQWITEGLERPNGLFVEESRVMLTSSGSQDLKVIDKTTGTFETVTTGIGAGDGLEYTGMEGHYIASSWTGEVFLIRPDFSKETLLKTSDQEINSADIGFNLAEQVVYVPTFFDNRVVAYRLEEK